MGGALTPSVRINIVIIMKCVSSHYAVLSSSLYILSFSFQIMLLLETECSCWSCWTGICDVCKYQSLLCFCIQAVSRTLHRKSNEEETGEKEKCALRDRVNHIRSYLRDRWDELDKQIWQIFTHCHRLFRLLCVWLFLGLNSTYNVSHPVLCHVWFHTTSCHVKRRLSRSASRYPVSF